MYLGGDVSIAGSALSPDGRWLLAASTAKSAERGKGGYGFARVHSLSDISIILKLPWQRSRLSNDNLRNIE